MTKFWRSKTQARKKFQNIFLVKDALDKLPEESRTGYPKEKSKLLCLFLFYKNAQICKTLRGQKSLVGHFF